MMQNRGGSSYIPRNGYHDSKPFPVETDRTANAESDFRGSQRDGAYRDRARKESGSSSWSRPRSRSPSADSRASWPSREQAECAARGGQRHGRSFAYGCSNCHGLGHEQDDCPERPGGSSRYSPHRVRTVSHAATYNRVPKFRTPCRYYPRCDKGKKCPFLHVDREPNKQETPIWEDERGYKRPDSWDRDSRIQKDDSPWAETSAKVAGDTFSPWDDTDTHKARYSSGDRPYITTRVTPKPNVTPPPPAGRPSSGKTTPDLAARLLPSPKVAAPESPRSLAERLSRKDAVLSSITGNYESLPQSADTAKSGGTNLIERIDQAPPARLTFTASVSPQSTGRNSKDSAMGSLAGRLASGAQIASSFVQGADAAGTTHQTLSWWPAPIQPMIVTDAAKPPAPQAMPTSLGGAIPALSSSASLASPESRSSASHLLSIKRSSSDEEEIDELASNQGDQSPVPVSGGPLSLARPPAPDRRDTPMSLPSVQERTKADSDIPPIVKSEMEEPVLQDRAYKKPKLRHMGAEAFFKALKADHPQWVW